MKTLRHHLIRQGIISPASLAETREVFPFPVKLYKQHTAPIWQTYHIERIVGRMTGK